jgi:aerobic-type carbon monoxide dehydrogenase small subunit (CoxS/CutS family)
MLIELTVNGAARRLELEGDELLVDVMHRLGLASVRLGCGVGLCGSCTVLLDGAPVSSCLLLGGLAHGREVTTVEGLAGDDPLLEAFDRLRAFQCGYCTPGMILTAKALAMSVPQLDVETAREWMSGSICRCGSYRRIEQAIMEAFEPREET